MDCSRVSALYSSSNRRHRRGDERVSEEDDKTYLLLIKSDNKEIIESLVKEANLSFAASWILNYEITLTEILRHEH